MTFSRLVTLLATLVLAAALTAPVGADEHEGDDEYYPTAWVEVGKEAKENSFADSDPELGPIGNAIGADLRNGSVRMLDAETLEFRIELWNLPATGGAPEAIRYTWDFTVFDEEGGPRSAQLDGKWSNYSRGACDPTSGQCNPPEAMPRDPGMQPFLFRANQKITCLGADPDPVELPEVGEVDPGCTGLNFQGYDEIDVLQGAFDPDPQEDGVPPNITIAAPLAAFNQIDGVVFGHCSEIRPRAGLFGGMIESMPSAFISSSAFPYDAVRPKTSKEGGGVYEVPPPEGFADCEEYLASL